MKKSRELSLKESLGDVSKGIPEEIAERIPRKKNLESCKNPGAILDRIPTIVRESTWKEFREIPLKI